MVCHGTCFNYYLLLVLYLGTKERSKSLATGYKTALGRLSFQLYDSRRLNLILGKIKMIGFMILGKIKMIGSSH